MVSDRGRMALLWGGPEDGGTVYVPPGDLPRLLGQHRDGRGQVVTIRGAGVLENAPDSVAVYEHVTIDLLTAWRSVVGARGRLFDPAGHRQLEDVPLYVHRELATRWLTQGQM
jgi:hypothetical protein